MKKKIMIIASVVVVAVFVTFNVMLNSNTTKKLSELALVNVEALANNESGNGDGPCVSSSLSYCSLWMWIGNELVCVFESYYHTRE